MMKKAEEIDKAKDEKLQAELCDIEDTKKQNGVFKQKLKEYNKPFIFSVFGILAAAFMGLLTPAFGPFMI